MVPVCDKDYQMRTTGSMVRVASTVEVRSHAVHKTNVFKVDGLMLLLLLSTKARDHDVYIPLVNMFSNSLGVMI